MVAVAKRTLFEAAATDMVFGIGSKDDGDIDSKIEICEY